MDLPNPNIQNPKVDLTERDVVLRSASAVPPPPDRKLASVAKLSSLGSEFLPELNEGIQVATRLSAPPESSRSFFSKKSARLL